MHGLLGRLVEHIVLVQCPIVEVDQKFPLMLTSEVVVMLILPSRRY